MLDKCTISEENVWLSNKLVECNKENICRRLFRLIYI